MTWYSKHFGTAALAMVAAVASASQPTFSHNRTVDYGPHCCVGNPMAMVTAPSGTSVYFGDWFDDDIFYVGTPLTTDGTNNDLTNTIEAQDTPGAWSAGGWSYQGGGVDGSTIYLGGANGTNTQYFATTGSPGSWTTAQITGITGTYSGPSVVSTGKIVAADYNTGALQFFNIASNAATTDGSAIANSNAGTAKTLSVAYDATSGKIFAYMVDNNLTRRIDVFNSNGTAAGTTYVGTWAAGAAGTLTAAGSGATSHNRSAQMTINNEHRILIVPFRDGTSDGWDVFDIGTVGATGTPYKQIRSADLNTTGYTGTGRDMSGAAVFANGAYDYLALNFWNKLVILNLTPGSSAVDEWSLY